MKKRILLIVIISFMFMGVVSAASLWGNYKGNQIIRLTVDGVPVKVSDAPAVSMDGRTMIPIYLLKEAGVKYSWDNKNQTVNISSKGTSSPAIINNESTIKIKAMVEAADFYISLENLGNMINGLSDHLSLVFDGNQLGKGTTPDYERLNRIIDSYNFFVNNVETKKATLITQGVNINKANEILNIYFKALESYKLAYAGMDKFIASNSQADFDEYLDNAIVGSDNSFDGKVMSKDEYSVMIDKALNY